MANDTTDHYNVFKMVDAYVDGDTVVEVGYWNKFDASGKEQSKGNYSCYLKNVGGTYIYARDRSRTISLVKYGVLNDWISKAPTERVSFTI
jgi:hypothetical protein